MGSVGFLTYLYVAMNLFFDLDGTGLGYFSAFVAGCALVFAGLNFWRDGFGDNGFGVIWLHWAFLWGLFFVVLGLGMENFGRYTGAVAAIQGIVTGAIPAFLLLTGNWSDNSDAAAIVLAAGGVIAFIVLWPMLRGSTPVSDQAPAVAT